MSAPELSKSVPAATPAVEVAGAALTGLALPVVAAPPAQRTLEDPVRRFFLPYSRGQRVALALVDVALLVSVGALAALALEPYVGDGILLARAAAFAFVGVLGLFAADCYDARGILGARELAARVLLGILIAAPALALVIVTVPVLAISGKTLAFASALAAATLVPIRICTDLFLRKLGLASDRVVLVGNGPGLVDAVKRLATVEGDERVLGWVGARDKAPAIPGIKRLGSYRALAPLATRRGATRVIVDSKSLGADAATALVAIREAGLPWVDAGELLERLQGKLDLARLDPRLVVFATGLEEGVPEAVAVRRLFEIFVSGVLLVLLSPILLLTALAVKLESRGPALFTQVRTGRGGRPFTIYKFRTMRNDAEAAGPSWAKQNDPRVTRLGKIMRKTRLDELPQFWNVFKGDMSFIGPRPERPFFVEKIAAVEPAYRLRHVVRPGVTGWAQVKYRYGATMDDSIEKLRYDLYYVFRWSPLLDLEVVLETVKVMLRGSNDH